ncbi:MAG: hypothetical protein J6V52_02345 [Bacteroidaceae bacterium]|nr:hypothetical protein [Bacteroidaceae bacterium]
MYKNMIQEARKTGRANEDAMWRSVENVEELLEDLRQANPEKYWHFMRKAHESLNGPHFDCQFAKYTVEGLEYTDAEGVRQKGAHWTPEQVEAAWARKAFKPGTTPWDKYVGANAMYADLCKEFSDEDVLKAAYLFFFADEDWKGDGKVWQYFKK